MSRGILFCGDPHGEFSQIVLAVRETSPAAVILLGDMDLPAPLDEVMAPVLESGTEVWWIPGNHDGDREDWHDRLFLSSLADRNIHGRVVEIDGLRVAGLGGVFRGRIWDPREHFPKFLSRDYFLAQTPGQRWRGGLPRRHRVTIFPDDVSAIVREKVDILVTHEAPTTVSGGWEIIGGIASAMGASAVIHGHHHVSYAARLPSGVAVHGVDTKAVLHSSDLDLQVQPAPAR
jgi:predicted phosphodiesterase